SLVIAFLGFIATSYRRLGELERKITVLTRELALTRARLEGPDPRREDEPQGRGPVSGRAPRRRPPQSLHDHPTGSLPAHPPLAPKIDSCVCPNATPRHLPARVLQPRPWRYAVRAERR